MQLLGEINIENNTLGLYFFSEVIYIPSKKSKGCYGGLFNKDGKLIPQAITRRYNNILLKDIDSHICIDKLPTVETVGSHFFLGTLSDHFGHFLLESTARLWAMLYFRQVLSEVNYLYCGRDISILFNRPYINDIFSAASIALKPENFLSYKEPCRIKNVFIVSPAFELLQQGNVVFRELMRRIGNDLVEDLDEINNSNHTPLYLSKSKLTKGVSRIINENEIEACLKEKGVDIIYPETLGFPQQIREITTRKYILSSVGSALHTLILCPSHKVISAFAMYEKMPSTYMIIDQLCENTGLYLTGKEMGMLKDDKPNAKFKRSFYATNPHQVANALLQNLKS